MVLCGVVAQEAFPSGGTALNPSDEDLTANTFSSVEAARTAQVPGIAVCGGGDGWWALFVRRAGPEESVAVCD